MAVADPETDRLLRMAREGNASAGVQLLARHRDRLRRMVDIRMDRRLSSRVDPSDIVQETMADAARRLPEYLQDAPLPFYAWLRRLAQEHLADAYSHHIQTQKRTVTREADGVGVRLPDDSVLELAAQIIKSDTSPSGHVLRDEIRDQVHDALKQLDSQDSEVLVMRYVEQMSNSEIADALDITPGAVKMRHLRALERIHGRLGEQAREYLR